MAALCLVTGSSRMCLSFELQLLNQRGLVRHLNRHALAVAHRHLRALVALARQRLVEVAFQALSLVLRALAALGQGLFFLAYRFGFGSQVLVPQRHVLYLRLPLHLERGERLIVQQFPRLGVDKPGHAGVDFVDGH